jgi:hypothetical protein
MCSLRVGQNFEANLRRLRSNLLEGNINKIEEILSSELHEEEIAWSPDSESILERWVQIKSMLKEEVPMMLIIGRTSQNLDVKQVLVKLRSTDSYLKHYKMKRLGGSFEDIGELSDEESLHLLQGILRCVRK